MKEEQICTVAINVNLYIWMQMSISYPYLLSTKSVISVTIFPTEKENAFPTCPFSFLFKLMNGVK